MKNSPENPKILSLDTSSKYCSISILDGPEILTEYNFITENQLSSILIPGIEFVLKTVKWNLNEIDVYGVGIGPGSFTGIRVGLATIKGLTYECEKPIVPVITLKALAYKFPKSKALLISIIDAKRDEIYLAGYNFSGDKLNEVITPSLIQINELKARLRAYSNLHFIGEGLNTYKDFLKENFKDSTIIFRSPFLASEICKIAYSQYLKKQYITDIQKLKPFYIRKPDAERNQQKKNKNTKSQIR